MHQAPGVPTFHLSLKRDGRASQVLDVPCTFNSTAARYDRLVAFLAKEHWAVDECRHSASPNSLAGCSKHELHAAELVFIRQLGMLRTRSGIPVPEKVVGKLLGIGVKRLHTRCEEVFGCTWAAFAAPTASTPSGLSTPTASSQPCDGGEDAPMCPAASPSVTAALPAVVTPATNTTAPSAAIASALELVPEPICPLLAAPIGEDDEFMSAVSMIYSPCAAGDHPEAAAAADPATATTPRGYYGAGIWPCEELDSVSFAGQQQPLQPAAAEPDAFVPPTPPSGQLEQLSFLLPLVPTPSAPAAQPLALQPGAPSAAMQPVGLPLTERLTSMGRMFFELRAGLPEDPLFGAAPAAPAGPVGPALPGCDALMAVEVPEPPSFPLLYPGDPLNLPPGTSAYLSSFIPLT